ncbi:hypothetical protein ACHQM5_019146 [Ranunculus cassubicifolius]
MHAAAAKYFPGRRITSKLIFSVPPPSPLLPTINFPNITHTRNGWVYREINSENGYQKSFWDWEDLGDGKKPCWSGFSEPFRKSIRSGMKTEEVEPGKFIRKSHNIMEIRRKSDGVVVESRTYDTEEEVTKEEAERGPGPSNFQLEIPPFLRVRPAPK